MATTTSPVVRRAAQPQPERQPLVQVPDRHGYFYSPKTDRPAMVACYNPDRTGREGSLPTVAVGKGRSAKQIETIWSIVDNGVKGATLAQVRDWLTHDVASIRAGFRSIMLPSKREIEALGLDCDPKTGKNDEGLTIAQDYSLSYALQEYSKPLGNRDAIFGKTPGIIVERTNGSEVFVSQTRLFQMALGDFAYLMCVPPVLPEALPIVEQLPAVGQAFVATAGLNFVPKVEGFRANNGDWVYANRQQVYSRSLLAAGMGVFFGDAEAAADNTWLSFMPLTELVKLALDADQVEVQLPIVDRFTAPESHSNAVRVNVAKVAYTRR